MRRREFLACGTALLPVALAGCAHPSVVLDLNRASAEDIARDVALHPDRGSDEYQVVKAAVETGSANRTGRYALFDRTDIVRLNSSFYEVSETRITQSEQTVYEVLIDCNPENTTASRGVIRYENLPAADRQRLDQLLTEDCPPPQDGYDIGIGYGSREDVGNTSVFVPTREYDILIYNGSRYRVAVNTQTAPRATYHYSVSKVADSLTAFANQIRSEYVFTLTARSEAERNVIEKAIDSGYFEDTDAFRSIIDRLQDQQALSKDEFYGTWLLTYDGVEYLTYAEW